MLILASASPRRREILANAGIAFEARAAEIDERAHAAETPVEYVTRLATEKARAIPGDLVLGADTVVVIGGEMLGKPADPEDARRMLRLLSGRDHVVVTGICLRRGSREVVDCAETLVRFAQMSEEEIRDYVSSGEPMDKAGAYAIQGLASKFIERIEGCYYNVVGLPVALVWRGLRSL